MMAQRDERPFAVANERKRARCGDGIAATCRVDKRDAYSGSVHSHAMCWTPGLQVETDNGTLEQKPPRFT